MASELKIRKRQQGHTLLKAFVLTFVLHFIALALFKVQLVPFFEEQTPPMVSAYTNYEEVQEISAQEDKNAENQSPSHQLQSFAYAIHKPSPNQRPQWTIPQAKPEVVIQKPTLEGTKQSLPFLFEQVENRPFSLLSKESLLFGTRYKPVKIHILGNLSQKEPLYIPYADTSQIYPPQTRVIPHLFTFEVKVEEKTGKVFYVTPTQAKYTSEQRRRLALIAQKMVKELTFEKKRKSKQITDGIVEVVLSIEEGRTLPQQLNDKQVIVENTHD